MSEEAKMQETQQDQQGTPAQPESQNQQQSDGAQAQQNDGEPQHGSDGVDDKKMSPAARRIAQLNARLKAAERERDLLLAAMQAKTQEPPATVATDSIAQPGANKDISELVRAEVDKALFQERLTREAQQRPDWHEKMEVVNSLRMPEETIREIVKSPHGAEIIYRLGSDPDLAARVAESNLRGAMREIVRMELEIEQGARQKASAAKSSAPAPIRPVVGTAVAEKDPSKMSMEEYIEWRKKQTKQT